MLSKADTCKEVMIKFTDLIQGQNLVVHNASFEKRFLDSEMQQISSNYGGQFACSLLVSRQLYQSAPNHKLNTLISYKGIASNGRYHRALYATKMTEKLWLIMIDDIKQQMGSDKVPFSMVRKLTKTTKANVNKFFGSLS